MVTSPKRHSTSQRRHVPATRFLTAEQYADVYLAAYYNALNAHRPFRAALGELEHAVRNLDEKAGRSALVGSEAWNAKEWPAEALTLIEQFAATWKLPARSVDDVRDALAARRLGANTDEKVEIAILIRTRALWINPAIVSATPPEPFEYDAELQEGSWARKQAQQRADSVYEEMLTQIEKVEAAARSAGRRPLHPRHLPDRDEGTGQVKQAADLRDGARRLFEKVVRRRSWQDIARAEYRELNGVEPGPGELEDSHIREQVGRWAKALGVSVTKSG